MSGSTTSDAERRVRLLVEGAKRLADPATELGRRARGELVRTTGLSAPNVELGLAECLETRVSDEELRDFCRTVAPANAAHVLLSANVFVGAHRALALALAGSSRVRVRPSRREPAFARLLADAVPGLFELVAELSPAPGDVVWAYGSDATLRAVRASLEPAISFHGHGAGIGLAVVDAANAHAATARALARDVVPFDQRGCLSPRAVAFAGTAAQARAFAELVAGELAALEASVPLGVLDADEAADVTRFRDTVAYASSVLPAGRGFVGTTGGADLVVAPVGRNLAVSPTGDLVGLLATHAKTITALGFATRPELEDELREAIPGARASVLGRMQRPAFDGPVDRRGLAYSLPPSSSSGPAG